MKMKVKLIAAMVGLLTWTGACLYANRTVVHADQQRQFAIMSFEQIGLGGNLESFVVTIKHLKTGVCVLIIENPSRFYMSDGKTDPAVTIVPDKVCQ